MKCKLIAAGTRMPAWVGAGFSDYQRRLRAPMKLQLIEVPVATRRGAESPLRAVAREGSAMLAALGREDYVVALEVAGKTMSTEQLSAWLDDRLRAARVVALLIGGPDGLADECRERADFRWSLSPLTLPHGMVRVIVAEQIYRAMSMQAGHPYHRA